MVCEKDMQLNPFAAAAASVDKKKGGKAKGPFHLTQAT